MDNLSHTLVGLAAGEAAVQLRAAKGRNLRPIFWLTSALANSFADIDFIYARLTPGKLGYLLHHRGHTHTIALAVPEAIIVAGLVWLLARARRWQLNRGDWAWVAALSLLGALSHIGFDALNSYGVHPYWPIASTWTYGDALFIVEPAIWVTLLPALLLNTRSPRGRFFLGGLLVFAIGLAAFSGYVPWMATVALAAVAAALWLCLPRLGATLRIGVSLAACATLVTAFIGVSTVVRRDVTRLMTSERFGSKILDLALTPYPVNPLCWSLLTVETLDGSYIARRANFAVVPSFFPVSRCPNFRAGRASSFPLAPVPAATRPEIAWSGQFVASLSELRSLYRASCAARAMLRFLRVPAWMPTDNGGTLLGDLRFERGAGKGFAVLEVRPGQGPDDCPPYLPGWTEPRMDLLLETRAQ